MKKTPPIGPIIALGHRLRGCPKVRTLGVRPNYSDYTAAERALIVRAAKIYYPSTFYADLFDSMGKPIFPSRHTYACAQDKIKQTALFNLVGVSHPRTRVFYGKRQKREILDGFRLPMIAKVPRGSSLGRGVFLIHTAEELAAYCRRPGPAYIQEYLPMDRDIRVVVIGQKVVHSYWRIAADGAHCTNVAAGGQVDLSPVPQEALQLALDTARLCQWDDVGIDICQHDGRYYVLEGNMKYGLEGFERAGMDYRKLLCDMIAQGEI